MPKPEWGEKRICLDCSAKFYDMQRSPIVCPTCDTEFVVPVTTGRASRTKTPIPKPKPVKPAVVDDDATLVADDDDDDDDISDDPALDLLDDDDDDDDLIEGDADLAGADDGTEKGPEKPKDPATS